jgi:lysophospholipase L1-like esterase
VRRAVNAWIRDGGAFDAVVDLDRVFADPADPQRLRAEFDSGDGVHPNDAGQRAIAAAMAGSPGFIRAVAGPRPPAASSSGR